ncbi:MAG: hypothetical protein ABFS12_01725 [Bacteroidota bacterium]
MSDRQNILLFTVIVVLVFSFVTSAQIQSLKVGNVLPGQIDMGAFYLSEKSKIEIDGLAASFDQWQSYLNYYAWIIKTDSRKLVWRTSTCEDYEKEVGEFVVNRELELSEGNYEVYFAAGHDYDEFKFNGLENFLGNVFKKKKEYIGEFRDNFFIAVTGTEKFTIVDPEEVVNERNKNAIAAITRVGDYENIVKKFSLLNSTEIIVYGVGEGINKQFYDFGYIYDVNKNKRVWMFNTNDAEKGGGCRKNIKVQANLTLPKGSYYVTYISDDSHSFDEWNAIPPSDPQYWGITIFAANDKGKENVIPFIEADVNNPVVDLSKAQNDQLLSQGFSISKKLKVRVKAIGEGINEMADYGWIINADTRETVWKMRARNTDYAGGSYKNRIVDETIYLKKGTYIAYYVTDDSHSFMNWNDAPPYQADDWGLKIWTEDPADYEYVELFDDKGYMNKNLIIEIIQVENDELRSENFHLEESSNIRIISLGEGGNNEMFDYSWIETTDGKVVWEMKLKKTYHAGGAKKNRIFNDVISLPSGEYKVYYKSDDSHSYIDWNMTPPDDKERYGITILLEEE